jgi:Holliday junction resolvase RusA-like endonuclease
LCLVGFFRRLFVFVSCRVLPTTVCICVLYKTQIQTVVDKTLQDTNTNSRRKNTTRQKYKESSTKHYKTQIQIVVGKTLQETNTNSRRKNTTRHKYKQSSAKHYKTQIQTVIDKTLQDTNTNSRFCRRLFVFVSCSVFPTTVCICVL